MREENAMTKRWWGVAGLWLLAPVMLLAGCAAGGTYRGAASADAYISNVSPSLSGTDPALRQWYTAPYFMPNEMP
jgi:hypothetical protein